LQIHKKGLRVVGVPKTIDNDLRGCLRSFHAGASRLSIMRMAAMSIMISEVWTMYS
jgi:6-phosphofructokinase